jgi:protein-tyrosine phosphatase
MGLDYSRGCVNFRDVGEWLECLAGRRVIPHGRLLRGGKIDYVSSAGEIGSPGTILCLRGSPDPEAVRFGADFRHFPAANDLERYDTGQREVRAWINHVVGCISAPETRLPVLVHCTSGKDRTGVIVAAVLLALGVQKDLIVKEYLLSDGGVDPSLIQEAIDKIGDPVRYLRRVDVGALRAKLLS